MAIMTESFNELMQETENDVIFESDKTMEFSWLILPKTKTWMVDFSQTFKDDWKDEVKTKFVDTNIRFAKFLKRFMDTHNIRHSTYDVISGNPNVRRVRAAFSSSGQGKDSGERVLFGIYVKKTVIYFAAMVTQAQHHADQKDTEAIKRAKKELNKKIKEWGENPA